MQFWGSHLPIDLQNADLYLRCSRPYCSIESPGLSSKDWDQGMSDPFHQIAEQARVFDLCCRGFESWSEYLNFDICSHWLVYCFGRTGCWRFHWWLSNLDWIHFECSFSLLPLSMPISWLSYFIYGFASDWCSDFVVGMFYTASPMMSALFSVSYPSSLISLVKRSCCQKASPQVQVLTNHE